MKLSKTSFLYYLAIITCILSFTVSVLFCFEYVATYQEVITPAKKIASAKTQTLAKDINHTMLEASNVAAELAAKISSAYQKQSVDTIPTLLDNTLRTSSDIHGIGMAFAPYAYHDNLRLFAPYYFRSKQGIEKTAIENSIDYTLKDFAWYRQASQQTGWQLVRSRTSQDPTVIQYGYPILIPTNDAAHQKIGLLWIDLLISDIHQSITDHDLGRMSFGVLLDQHGNVLWHPNKKHLTFDKTAEDVAQDSGHSLLHHIGQMAINQTSGEVRTNNYPWQQSLWASVHSIESSGWTLASFFVEGDLTKGNTKLHHLTLGLIFFLVTFFTSLVCIRLSNGEQKQVFRLWLRSAQLSVIFTIGVIAIWFLSSQNIAWMEKKHTVITDKTVLKDFKNRQIKSALDNKDPMPIFIPTGVFVQSIEFTSANNVILTGYVWQHYAHHIPSNISRGFILPEAETTEIRPAYQRKEDNGIVHGWYFHVKLRQDFDYSTFPFDQQAVWMRLWHKDFDKNVILTPTIDAYDLMHPEKKPGIEKDFVLPGWSVTSSFFNYRYNSYNTDFGIPLYVGQKEFPELYYQIGVRRMFLNPFVSNLTPIIVVLLMLFAVLITSSKDNDKMELLGFNASTILASCSALFFVVLISHIDLRNTLAANRIFYLEYFYIVTYFALLAISVNSILFSYGVKVPFIQYRDNLMPKIVYWPFITVIVFLITLIKFY